MFQQKVFKILLKKLLFLHLPKFLQNLNNSSNIQKFFFSNFGNHCVFENFGITPPAHNFWLRHNFSCQQFSSPKFSKNLLNPWEECWNFYGPLYEMPNEGHKIWCKKNSQKIIPQPFFGGTTTLLHDRSARFTSVKLILSNVN